MKAEAAARKAAEHGRHIFIYNNIRTNQTVYSLQRGLNNHAALLQLPYAGKKTVPAKLRKDLWRPLATVSFSCPNQGLSAYRTLRELRKLHEQHWDANKEYPMLPPDRQEKLKTGKTLPTKKEKGKIIMDQKANTVADLAAVLKMHEEHGAKQLEQIRARDAEVREKEKEQIAKLKSLVEKIKNGERERVRLEVESLRKEQQDGQSNKERKGQLHKRIERLHKYAKKLARAEEELALKQNEHTENEFARALSERVQNGDLDKIEKELREASSSLEENELEIESIARSLEPKKGEPREEQSSLLEKRKLAEAEVERLKRRVSELTQERNQLAQAAAQEKLLLPERQKQAREKDQRNSGRMVLSSEVTIKWSDIVDAQYAESWPSKVQHDVLGFTRHAAPDPNVPAKDFPGVQEAREAEEAAKQAALEQAAFEEARAEVEAEEGAAKGGKRAEMA